MLKGLFNTRFVVPLFAMVLAFALALAPAAFAATYTAAEVGEGDDPSAPFGPGAAFENAEITFDGDQSFVYTGKEIKPAISVSLLNEETQKKEVLVEGTDYKVSYEQNVNAGTAYVCAWCQDEERTYTVKQKFSIAKARISSAKVKIAKQTYTGKKLKPTPKITYKGMTLKKGTDFTVTYKKNKKVGTARAIIKGKGNFKGKAVKKFKIVKANIGSAKFSKVGAKTYTAKKIKPKVTVKYKGKKLKANRDYTVKYKNNLNVGKASILFKGKGNFKGKKTLNFKITPVSIKKCGISYQKSWHWNGGIIKPPVTLTYKGKKLQLDKDYLVSYSKNDKVGTAYISIQGKGNFTGSDRETFEITLLPLTNSSISTVPESGVMYNYTGEAILPQVTVKIHSGGKTYIVSPEYYDVFYDGLTRAQAQLEEKFKGNPKKDRTFKIRIQAKEGSNFFTGYRIIKYTILKQADQT